MAEDQIERAAKAMRTAYNRHLGDGTPVPWEQAAPEPREAWMVCARAAAKVFSDEERGGRPVPPHGSGP